MEIETKTNTVDEKKKRSWIKCVLGVLGFGTAAGLGAVGAEPLLGIGMAYCAAIGATGGVISAIASLCGKEPKGTKIEIVIKNTAVLSWIPVLVGLVGMFAYATISDEAPSTASLFFLFLWLVGVVLQVGAGAMKLLLNK